MQKYIYFHSWALQREIDNQFNKIAVALLNSEEIVGHLPREYSRIAWYFVARGGSISVEVSSHHCYCKQLCGGMEIPCWVTFTCSRKATLNRLKALLKVLIYAIVRHGVQMFSQISCIPDLTRKFWAKRCSLYAGVYGTIMWQNNAEDLFSSFFTLITLLFYLIKI